MHSKKKDINKIVEEAVAKGTAIVRNKMHTMETRLTTQAKNFATYTADKAAKALKNEMATPRQALSKTMAALKSSDMLDKDDLMAINEIRQALQYSPKRSVHMPQKYKKKYF